MCFLRNCVRKCKSQIMTTVTQQKDTTMTQTVLRIDASARTEGSVSRLMGDQIVNRLAPTQTLRRDLAAPVPPIDADWLAASATPANDRTAGQRNRLALSDQLVAELQSADTIVIATPIYNFSVPSNLKAWFDMVARAGITFRYTDTGPIGLLAGRRVILAIASGGTEVDGPLDFATPWLRHAMGFIGITDVQIVRSDRQMLDAAASQARAAADLDKLAA
jgi:FMN-dependent NADH-azoreductase